jgi:TolB-like protein
MKNNFLIFAHKANLLLCFSALFFCHTVKAENIPGIAQIELCTGEIQISKRDKNSQAQGILLPGDALQTTDNPNSRCRVAFPNGNFIDIGSATTVKFDKDQQITLMQGRLIAYAMPTLGQAGQAMEIHIGNGGLALAMGKVLVTMKDKPEIAVFNDLVSAVWHDRQGEKTLYPGNLVKVTSGSAVEITQASQAMEGQVSEQISPEIPAVNQATQAFKARDLQTSTRLFTQIQQAFPYNAAAAYHLGLFDLNVGNTSKAVQQWQKYATIDPEGAKKSGVIKQLTLMNSKSIQDEVTQAIANEKMLSELAPEPNSIAVNPLINKGAEQYGPIGKGLTAFVITDLAKVPGLKVLEREKLQKLIDEIKLSQTGELVETSSRVRAGRIMRAEKLMIGDYLIGNSKEGQ